MLTLGQASRENLHRDKHHTDEYLVYLPSSLSLLFLLSILSFILFVILLSLFIQSCPSPRDHPCPHPLLS